jgi:two-component system, NarL family, sensor kinase
MNSSRHARAESCLIRLSCPWERTLEIEVVDNGIGLPESLSQGVGLSSMRERAAELGGTWEIGPAQGYNGSISGTRIFARLPIGEVTNSQRLAVTEGRSE